MSCKTFETKGYCTKKNGKYAIKDYGPGPAMTHCCACGGGKIKKPADKKPPKPEPKPEPPKRDPKPEPKPKPEEEPPKRSDK